MREVERRARIGDKVKIVNASIVPMTDGEPEYKNGDILTVIEIYHGSQVRYAEGVSDDRKARVLNPEEYVVLEGEKEMRFKVGDKVKVVKNVNMHCFEIGELIRITNVTNIDYRAESLDGAESWWVTDGELEPAPFALSDLKPCMVAKIRDGRCFLVSQLESGLGLVVESEGKSLYFYDFNDDLTYKNGNKFDIIEVYGYRNDYLIHSLDLSSANRKLLWKREEPKPKRKMTVAEICKELGEEIEIVKGE